MPNKHFYHYDLKNTVSILDDIHKTYGVYEITYRRDIAYGMRGTKPSIETIDKIKTFYEDNGFKVIDDDALNNKVKFYVQHQWYERMGII